MTTVTLNDLRGVIAVAKDDMASDHTFTADDFSELVNDVLTFDDETDRNLLYGMFTATVYFGTVDSDTRFQAWCQAIENEPVDELACVPQA